MTINYTGKSQTEITGEAVVNALKVALAAEKAQKTKTIIVP